MIITHTIAQLPIRAQRMVMKSLVATINQSIIGYARSHIKALKYAERGETLPSEQVSNEQAAIHGTNTFDNLNREEIGKDLKSESDRFMNDAGNEIVETPLQLCRKFSVLRNWLEQMLEAPLDYNPRYDAPYSVANSLAFNIMREPQTNTLELTAMAEATSISLARLQAVGMKQVEDGHTELKDNASRILGIYDDCSAYGENMFELDAERFNIDKQTQEDIGNTNFEILFASIPVQSQYKLGIKMNESMITASNDCVKLMLNPRQRGSREAAGDVKIIDAAREEHYNWLVAFDKKHSSELDAYAERGYMPVLPDEFEQPIVIAMDKQSAKEAQAATPAPAPPLKKADKIAPVLSKADAAIARFNKGNVVSL